MRSKLVMAILVMAGFFMINSCSNDDDGKKNKKAEEPTLSLSKDKVSFSFEGGKAEVEVTTNQEEWSFSTQEDWISISKENNKLTLDISENLTLEDRVGMVKVKAGKLEKSIEVSQDKSKQKEETIFKVSIPVKSTFNSSLVQKVINSNNEKVGEFCLEYIKDGKTAAQMITFYPANNGEVNTLTGYTLPDGGIVKWSKENNTCEYNAGSTNPTEIYVNKQGEVSFSTTNDKLEKTTIEPVLINDTRNGVSNNYKIVKIGTQYWMAENLNAHHYVDGTPITTGLNRDKWLETEEGAYTYYENNPENAKTMGALYNWYAVVNTKGLAPKGYKVSSEIDWAKMSKYLDPENYGKDTEYGARESETIAPLLKSTEGWRDNGSGNNLSGLNIFPCGSTSESKYMEYSGKERQAYFWTKNEYETKTAFFRRLYYDEVFTNRWFENKTYGYSVRCVREN